MGAKGAYIVRLLMVGDSSCGKTSLVLRFDQNVFSTKFVATIGVDYRDKMVKVCHLKLCTSLLLSALEPEIDMLFRDCAHELLFTLSHTLEPRRLKERQ